jgi:hypothetical protein
MENEELKAQSFRHFISYLRSTNSHEEDGYFAYIDPEVREKYLNELKKFEKAEATNENIKKVEEIAKAMNNSFVKLDNNS